jgi:hypothetical protein
VVITLEPPYGAARDTKLYTGPHTKILIAV